MLPALRLCARAAACAGLALWPFVPLPPGQGPLLAPSALLAPLAPLALPLAPLALPLAPSRVSLPAPPAPPAPPRPPPPPLDFFL